MSEPFAVSLARAQEQALSTALRGSNAVSEPYGLTLTEPEIQALTEARREALRYEGRVEIGEGVLPKLAFAFCDSPHIAPEAYASTLRSLMEQFYAFQNDAEDAFSDDELIEALRRVFDGRAQGSLGYLENLTTGDLWRVLEGDAREEAGWEEECDDE